MEALTGVFRSAACAPPEYQAHSFHQVLFFFLVTPPPLFFQSGQNLQPPGIITFLCLYKVTAEARKTCETHNFAPLFFLLFLPENDDKHKEMTFTNEKQGE